MSIIQFFKKIRKGYPISLLLPFFLLFSWFMLGIIYFFSFNEPMETFFFVLFFVITMMTIYIPLFGASVLRATISLIITLALGYLLGDRFLADQVYPADMMTVTHWHNLNIALYLSFFYFNLELVAQVIGDAHKKGVCSFQFKAYSWLSVTLIWAITLGIFFGIRNLAVKNDIKNQQARVVFVYTQKNDIIAGLKFDYFNYAYF